MTMKLNAHNAQANNVKSFAKSMLKYLSLATAALCLLTACASSTRALKPQIQGNLATLCEPIKQSDAKTLGDLVAFTTDLIGQYGECRAKHEALVKSLGEDHLAN